MLTNTAKTVLIKLSLNSLKLSFISPTTLLIVEPCVDVAFEWVWLRLEVPSLLCGSLEPALCSVP